MVSVQLNQKGTRICGADEWGERVVVDDQRPDFLKIEESIGEQIIEVGRQRDVEPSIMLAHQRAENRIAKVWKRL